MDICYIIGVIANKKNEVVLKSLWIYLEMESFVKWKEI